MKSKVKFVKTNKKQKVKFICKKKIYKKISNSLDESNVLYSDPKSSTVKPFHTRQVSFKLVADVIKKYFIHKVGYKIVFDDKATENVKNIVYVLTWINCNL